MFQKSGQAINSNGRLLRFAICFYLIKISMVISLDLKRKALNVVLVLGDEFTFNLNWLCVLPLIYFFTNVVLPYSNYYTTVKIGLWPLQCQFFLLIGDKLTLCA